LGVTRRTGRSAAGELTVCIGPQVSEQIKPRWRLAAGETHQADPTPAAASESPAETNTIHRIGAYVIP
jgi:hypothetical protein